MILAGSAIWSVTCGHALEHPFISFPRCSTCSSSRLSTYLSRSASSMSHLSFNMVSPELGFYLAILIIPFSISGTVVATVITPKRKLCSSSIRIQYSDLLWIPVLPGGEPSDISTSHSLPIHMAQIPSSLFVSNSFALLPEVLTRCDRPLYPCQSNYSLRGG